MTIHKILKITVIVLMLVLIPWAEAQQTQSAQSMKEYRHLSGLVFEYPADWVTKESTFSDVEFVPPDQHIAKNGPTEAYFLWGIGADANGPLDQHILEMLDALMAQIAPFLKRSEESEKLQIGNLPAVILKWSGNRPDGVAVIAHSHTIYRKGETFALVALGVEEQVHARQDTLLSMFSSFEFESGIREEALKGRWTGLPEPGSAQTQTAQAGGEIELHADGTFLMKGGSVTPEGDEQIPDTSGEWFADSSRLYLVSPGIVSLTFHYTLEGAAGKRVLSLLHPSGGRQVLQETPSK